MISIYTGISVTQENQIDFAIYSADDSTLRFYKRGEREYNTITVGETYNGHDVSSIINDVENLYGGGTIESTFYDSNHDAIKTVVFEDKITPTTSTNKWFYYETQLSTIEKLYNLDMSNVTDASYMFGECAALTSIDGMDNCDVSNVTNMGCMFSNCASLTDLSPLANWNVASVTYMYNMFSGCKSLTNLSPLAKWNPSSVILMQDMFSYCTELTDATTGLANWDTSSVNETGYMFYNDSKLTTLDISGWNISNVRIMENMFDGCTSLKTIYVGSGSGWAGWNTSGLSNPIGMFNNCTSLVGGAGTTYDKDHIDGDYARIDDPDNGMPGYFTDIADKDKSTDTTSTALETS
jgi:surface protein